MMFRGVTSRKLAALLLPLLLGHSPASKAHLGGDVRSVAADARTLHASVRATPLVGYEVHELQSSTGLTVREYVTATGAVFALSWNGAVAPDLQQLLGQYFPKYAAAVAARSHAGLQRSLRIEADELIVELSGRPRGYFGHAYLPAQLPPGFDVRTVR